MMRHTLLAVLGVVLLAGQASAETSIDKFSAACREAVYPDGKLTADDKISQQAYVGRLHLTAEKLGLKDSEYEGFEAMCSLYLHGASDAMTYAVASVMKYNQDKSKVAARGK